MRKILKSILLGLATLCLVGAFASCESTCVHDYLLVQDVPSTCAQAGYTKHACTKCATTRTTSKDLLPHTPTEDEGYAPTCTEAGLSSGSHCTVCGQAVVAQSVIEATGHSPETIKAGKEVTCTEDGLTPELKCTVCQVTYQQQTVIPAGHADADNDKICDRCHQVNATNFIEINDANGLKNITANLSANYRLNSDIDLANEEWNSIGGTAAFTGIFDGNGHTIKNLYLKGTDSKGLFYHNNGVIVNLRIENLSCKVEGSADFGGVAVKNSGRIIGCTLLGTGSFVIRQGMTIEGSAYSTGEANYTWSHKVGGICASNTGSLEDCAVSGSYNVEQTAVLKYTMNVFLASSYRSSVTVNVVFGALAGENSGKITDCTVSAAGYASVRAESTAKKCEAKSYANATLGALVGVNGGTVDSCSGKTLTVTPSKNESASSGGEATAQANCTQDATYQGLFGSRGNATGITYL